MQANIRSQKKLMFKIGFIIVLILLLLIPNFQIQSLIHERDYLRLNAVTEIENLWGGPQIIKGPLLSIPVIREIKGSEGTNLIESYLHLCPSHSRVDAEISSREKKRSIYEVVIYSSDVFMDVSFDLNHSLMSDPSIVDINYSEAVISMGVSDKRGLTEIIQATYNENYFSFESGTVDPYILDQGIRTSLPLERDIHSVDIIINLKMKGARSFHIKPISDQTELNIQGDWNSPGFNGGMLPLSSEVKEDGFKARWASNVYQRNQPAIWLGNKFNINDQVNLMGLELIQPADHYQKNLRTSKYSLLIISLTFVIFFFFEIFQKIKVHPVQYGLIGLSLSMFYLLLLSLTEHIGFNKAYILSAHTTIALISMYSYYTLKSFKRIGILIGVLTMIYGYLFILMQLETYALLTGTIGLLVILAIVMYLSRTLNWYELEQ